MTNRSRPMRALLPLVALLVAAGCGSAQASGSPSAAAPTGTAAASASAPPIAGGSGAAPPASLVPGAGALDALLPDEVAGVSMEYQSTTGMDIFGAGSPGSREFYEAVGADASQVTAAFGIGRSADRLLSIVAFQVEGVGEEVLRDQFVRAMRAQSGSATDANVGGKDVLEVQPVAGESTSYVYVADDVVFIVASQPVSLSAEALAALP